MKKLSLLLISIFFLNIAFAQSYKESLDKVNMVLGKYFHGTKYGRVIVENGFFYFYIFEWNNYAKAEIKQLDKAVNDDELDVVKLYSIDKKYSIYSNIATQIVKENVYSREMYFFIPFGSDIKNDRLELVKSLNELITRYNAAPPAVTSSATDNKIPAPICIKGNCENGEGTLSIHNGSYKGKTTLKGTFVNGKINGKGEYYRLVYDTKYQIQEETYVGNFKDGLYDGFGIYTLKSHYPKVKEKGFDKMESYEGDWKAGEKDGNGKYFCNYIYGEKEYVGQWKNGLEDGIGIRTYHSDGTTFNGLWREGSELNGKRVSNSGYVLYEGGKKESDAYWARMRKADVEREALAAKYYISSGQAERDRIEREDLAARLAEYAKKKKECVCDKCGGSGKISIKSAKIWYSDVYDNGNKVGTATNSGWEYEDLTCTRCLGTGKCK